MESIKILVVDDEEDTRSLLKNILEAEGWQVEVAKDGRKALEMLENIQPDVVILDIIMPGMDGIELCQRIKQLYVVPVIMLSCRNSEGDKVTCLTLGADDYITKPFSAKELMARIRVVLRHYHPQDFAIPPAYYKDSNLEVNFQSKYVKLKGKNIKLTPTEYHLLQELVLNAGKMLTYNQLLDRVWGPEYKDEKQYVHVFIGRLRDKLEPGEANPKYIITSSGVGYSFRKQNN